MSNRLPLTDAEALEASGHAAALGRNDPRYDLELAEMAQHVTDVANSVREVVVVNRQGRGSHVELRMVAPHHSFKVREAGETMGKLLEAPVRAVKEGYPDDGPSYAQPPRHVHYRDDRRERGGE